MRPDTRVSVPANQRTIRASGLLACCRAALGQSVRPTAVGTRTQCPVCEAEIVVDQMGAWKWAGVSTGLRRPPA